MTDTQREVATLSELLADLPRNWGRWGDEDEIGCLNYQTPAEVLRGVREVKSGKVFTLGLPIGSPGGDPGGRVGRAPGLVFSPELVRWFHEREIVSLSTDTIANEVTFDPETGIVLPLHAALMRNLGVLFSEILWFEELAEDCVGDRQWSFLYSAGADSRRRRDRFAGQPRRREIAQEDQMSIYDERPWRKHYANGLPHDIEPEHESMLAAFRHTAQRIPDKPALIYFERPISYRELDELSDALAAGLAAEGVTAGDRVAVYLQNVPQFPIAMLAAWKAGAIVVSASPMLRHKELTALLSDSSWATARRRRCSRGPGAAASSTTPRF
jgi:hypothetical protein